MRYRGCTVNILLFTSDTRRQTLARTDPRARHLLEVLGCDRGTRFKAGVIDGPTGTGTVLAMEEDLLEFEFRWDGVAPPLDDIVLLVGLPRPQSARKILHQAAALGCREIRFIHSRMSDPNYAKSRLWTTSEWRRHLLDGLQQSAATSLPAVTCGIPLLRAVQQIPRAAAAVALDNTAGLRRFGASPIHLPLVLAVGPERGWAEADLEILNRHHFRLCTLGTRILRVETACVAALSIAKSKLGDM